MHRLETYELFKAAEAVHSFQEAINRIEAGHCNLELKKQEIFVKDTKKRLTEAENEAKKKKGKQWIYTP